MDPRASLSVTQREVQDDLTHLLMKCASTRDATARDRVVARLDPNIAVRIPRAPAIQDDLSAIVSTCLARPRGLFELLAAVHSAEGESLPWTEIERYAARVEELYAPLGALFEADEVVLIERWIRILCFEDSTLVALRARVAPPSSCVRPRCPVSLPLLLAELCLHGPQRDGDAPPLVHFAERVVETAASPEATRPLRTWLDQACIRLEVPRPRSSGAEADHAPPGSAADVPPRDPRTPSSAGGPTSLLIVLRPTEAVAPTATGATAPTATEIRYQVQTWYGADTRGDLVPVPTSAFCTAATLAHVLEEAVSAVPDDAPEDPHIELVLPIELLEQPLDTLMIKDGFHARPIGALYKLIVRSYERLALPRWSRIRRNQWRQRWQRARGLLDDAPARELAVQPVPTSAAGADLDRALDRDDNGARPCLVLGGVPVRADLARLLDAGIPIAIWPRVQPRPERLVETLRELVSEPLGTLPERMLRLRRRETYQGSLVLLWDDPERWTSALSSLLRAPATT